MYRKNSHIKSEKWNWDSRYIFLFLSTVWIYSPILAIVWTWTNNRRDTPRPPWEVGPIETVSQPLWAQISATILGVAFIVTYVVVIYQAYFGRGSRYLEPSDRRRWVIRLALLGMATALFWLPYEDLFVRWPSIVIFVVIVWTITSTPDSAFSAVIISTIASYAMLALRYGGGVAFVNVVLVLALGFMVAGFVINNGVIKELYLERSRVRDQAITEERFRLARDLHDTVGHSMTQITLKAQLARRVLTSEPERASGELAEIEQLSRALSAEIRQSIAGDVVPKLTSELDRAAELLAAADIELHREIYVNDLSEELDTLFGWVIREGAMNVVKHNRATRCDVTVTRESDRFLLTVRDNGPGTATEIVPGQGLMGLRQRVEECGGSLHWQCTDIGFTLEVRVPTA
ncbi:MAG: sensor histidine kinase [Thermomicrobiales bacterium]|nr:sensor histidine kinase [Thermomicrobiales bacterium]MCO5219632.1 sensor histidine kinase [Thermomicrobiales bacterium]MCO5224703.1 sensor histidine kinase [Thermomicrobiales bacterium]MCO5228823.1 sensor histidine kinase [Thermomicrobiales bacterium]